MLFLLICKVVVVTTPNHLGLITMKTFVMYHIRKVAVHSLFMILVAIMIAAVVWFFADVMFDYQTWPFWKKVRVTWVILVVCTILDCLRVMIVNHRAITRNARIWGVQFSDVAIAMYKYNLVDQHGYARWTPAEFKQWYHISQMASRAVSAMGRRV